MTCMDKKNSILMMECNKLEGSFATNTEKTKHSGKRVTFGQLQLRQYSMTALDENPAVANGPAIMMGGNFAEYGPVSVDGFESRRGQRKHREEMKLSAEERFTRLKVSGYDEKDIRKAMARRAQIRRAKTLQTSSRDQAIELLVSKVKKVARTMNVASHVCLME